ncbi:MAG TPA: response regulator, partial [Candidatus Limnocylindria bacterium]|nr:response regulator [Candidatus Limnocylindria bacterium]
MRLLVVEDEPRLAADLRAALEAAGYAVDVAHDGAFADFCVETERYDSVILDLGLPR